MLIKPKKTSCALEQTDSNLCQPSCFSDLLGPQRCKSQFFLCHLDSDCARPSRPCVYVFKTTTENATKNDTFSKNVIYMVTAAYKNQEF